MPNNVSPRFLQQIANAVQYWLDKTRQLTDDEITALDRERTAIYRVLQYSLRVDSLVRTSAELILQVFKLIEQRGYWSEWIPVLESALVVLPPEAIELRIQLLNQTGFLYRLQRSFAMTLTYHECAAVLCNTNKQPADLAITRFHLANTYFDNEDYQQR